MRRFVAARGGAARRSAGAEQQHVDRELWSKAGALGMLLSDVPAEYGGSGGTFAHQAVMFEELVAAGDTAFAVPRARDRRALPPEPRHRGAEAALPAAARRRRDGRRDRDDRAGRRLRPAGRSARAPSATATHYVLNGSKTFISNGYLADLVIVVARTERRAGRARASRCCWSRPKDAPGFRVGRVLEKIGQKGQDTCELFFDDVRVPADNVLGGEPGRASPS